MSFKTTLLKKEKEINSLLDQIERLEKESASIQLKYQNILTYVNDLKAE